MPAETEVIACPACRHLVRVPADWLGTPVQCPECQAKFTAPLRDGDRLTEAKLLTKPITPTAAPSRRSDPLLALPAFGLILVGFASLIANGYLFVHFLTSGDGGRGWVKNQMPVLRQMGVKPQADDADQEASADQVANQLAPKFLWVWLAAGIVASLELAAGVAMLRRKNYRLAQLGCALAGLNLPHLCCVPGAVFGLWGLLLLMSDEGREHFLAG